MAPNRSMTQTVSPLLPDWNELQHIDAGRAEDLLDGILCACDDGTADIVSKLVTIGKAIGRKELSDGVMQVFQANLDRRRDASEKFAINPIPGETFSEAISRTLSHNDISALHAELSLKLECPGKITPTRDFSPELDEVRFSAKLHYREDFRSKADYRKLLDDLANALERK